MENKEIIRNYVDAADMVLVGIGTGFKSEDPEVLAKAYDHIRTLIDGKNYFVISESSDESVLNAGFKPDRVTAPVIEKEKSGTTADKNWETYMKWVMGSMNRNILMLELGVSLAQPEIIRFPFEKMAAVNMKANFIRVNKNLPFLPENLSEKAISVKVDPVELMIEVE
ncbi:hypothetical protein SAMN06296386_110112 [Lachnospiraceae bacterium]|nr:hypothetical protein SAMN06296386_110112 [Lachnospiraceae bacterium]